MAQEPTGRDGRGWRRGSTAVLALIVAWAVADVAMWTYLNVAHMRDAPFRGWLPIGQAAYYHLLYGSFAIVPAVWNLVLVQRRIGLGSQLGRWLLPLSLAPVAWGAGNVVWFWFNSCTSWGVLSCERLVAVPYPSAADALYLLLYPLAVTAAMSFARLLGVTPRDVLRSALATAPAAVLTTWVMLGSGVFTSTTSLGRVFDPHRVSPELTTILYLLGDVIAFGAMALLVACAVRLRHATMLVPLCVTTIGYAMLYAGDTQFFLGVANGTYHNAGLADLVYSGAMLLPTLGVTLFVRALESSGEPVVVGESGFQQAATTIVQVHARLLGDAAWRIAAEVPGLDIGPDRELRFLAAPRTVATRLLATYRPVTGELGHDACATALAIDAGADDELARWFAASPRAMGRNGPPRGARSDWHGAASFSLGFIVTFILSLLFDQPLLGIALSGCVGLASVSVGLTIRGRADRRRVAGVHGALADLVESLDQARTEERHRIATDIHDFALQQLVASVMHLEVAREVAIDLQADAAIAPLHRGEQCARSSLEALRRILRGIEPVSLYNFDVATALEEFEQEFQSTYLVPLRCRVVDVPDLLASSSLLVFRIITEACHNAGKHAMATSVEVDLAVVDGTLVITIADDGRGLPADAQASPTSGRGGWGLRLMSEQARMLDGTLVLQSEPGRGTEVRVLVPLPGRRPELPSGDAGEVATASAAR